MSVPEAPEKTDDALRRALDELQRANDCFRVIVEFLPVPIAITRKATGKVMYANDHFATLYGLKSARDLLGRAMTEFFVDPADRQAILQILERQGYLSNIELHLKTVTGTPFWASGYFRYLTYDGEPAVFGALVDISDRIKRSEELERRVRERTAELEKANAELEKTNEQLTTAGQRLREIVKWTPVSVAITRKATGEVIYANDLCARMFGFTHGGDLQGRNITGFYSDSAERSKLVQILEKQGYVSDYELCFKRVDGTLFWVAAYFQYLTFEGEEAVFGALADISDRKQRSEELERRVKERTAELEAARDGALAADRAKNEFLANVSHELRNPLNHINGYCELLELAVMQNGHDDLLPDLRKTRSSTKNLSRLVDDILDLTKMGAHNVRLEPRQLLVADFIRELGRAGSRDAQQNSNTLEVRVSDRAGSVWTDPDRLRQILSNLLNNAFKFTERGIITLAVDRETNDAGDWLIVAVTDTGIGMTAEEKTRLFSPFQQANPEIGRKYGGTGLGLALSQGYANVMGGKISVESEPGKGSTFTVRLPAVIAARAAPSTQASTVVPSAGNQVLVIDDDPTVHDLMARFVGAKGFRMHHARTGLEGLKQAKELRPAAITLDTLMPDLNGWEVLRLLKSDPETSDIPVIMLTVVDDKTRGYELGAAEFVTKPVEWNHLAAILGKYCSQDSEARAAAPLQERKTR